MRFQTEPGIDGAKDESPFRCFMSAVNDKCGDLWLARLHTGVWRYDGVSITQYPVKDGDASVGVYSVSSDRQGVLWLGTQEHGVYTFNGTMFEKFEP